MAKKKSETRPSNPPVAVRFTVDQIEKINEVAEDFQMSKQDVIRLSVAAGLKAMKKIGIAGLQEFVADQIKPVSKPVEYDFTRRSSSMVGESQGFELPFLGAVAAGEPVAAALNETVPTSKKFPEGFFVVEVNGRSMEPTLPDGSRIVCEPKEFTPANGAICIISDGQGSSVKRFDRAKKAYVSDNPDFPDLVAVGEVKLQGVFVEII